MDHAEEDSFVEYVGNVARVGTVEKNYGSHYLVRYKDGTTSNYWRPDQYDRQVIWLA